MELLFVILIAAGLGFIVHFVIPGRHAYGFLLLGSLSASVTALVWVALLWLGFTFDGGWIWVISLAAGVIAAIVTAVVLPRRRRDSDRALLAKLSGGAA
jgi:hypothetical protein